MRFEEGIKQCLNMSDPPLKKVKNSPTSSLSLSLSLSHTFKASIDDPLSKQRQPLITHQTKATLSITLTRV